MRNVLTKNNIIPENLPPEVDIKKIERRIKKEEEKLAFNSNRLL